ncbi:hypothetical protein tb265_40530 [Gemmatimonadetes bacterium T265]|nr:hypothetical protein tb265_40530 [Gemmatimonadetes bacterium T265]
MDPAEFRDAFERELRRLGLDSRELPGLAGSGDDWHGPLLAHVRALAPGAGWRDVFPDLPPDWRGWDAPRRYRPLGPYDYAELPAAPAVHVVWPDGVGTAERLDALVAAARAAGHAVHGAGPHPAGGPEHAVIVLGRGTSEDALGDFLAWVDARPDVTLATVPRTGAEVYAR